MASRSLLILFIVLLTDRVAASGCNCTPGLLGAIFGTFFVTLLIVAVILVILWFCCLRHRFRSTSQSAEAPVASPCTGVSGHSGHVWGVPSALKHFLHKCSIPPDSVHQVRLKGDPQNPNMDFSLAGRGVGVFLKDVSPHSNLAHIPQLHDGSHIIGMTVAFDSWPPDVAADFISRASPFRPHLHVRCQPIFNLDGLTSHAVLCGRAGSPGGVLAAAAAAESPELPEVAVEEEVVLRENSKVVQSAFQPHAMTSGSTSLESVDLSEEHPEELRQSGVWTFDRSFDVQPERVMTARRSMEEKEHSEKGSRSDSFHSSGSDFPGLHGDVFRATPLHLSSEDGMEFKGIDVSDGPPQLHAGDVNYCRQPSSLDSGFGTANIAFNGVAGGACSSSDASQDGPVVKATGDHEFEPRLPPSLSSSSTASSVIEEAIERCPNPRQLKETPADVMQLPELSALDRRIALKNIEIATLMLNDSHERLALNDRPPSESEPESAHEEKVLPTSREELRSAPTPLASRMLKLGAQDRGGHVNFAFTADGQDEERQDFRTKQRAESSDEAEFLELEPRANAAGDFELHEAFA